MKSRIVEFRYGKNLIKLKRDEMNVKDACIFSFFIDKTCLLVCVDAAIVVQSTVKRECQQHSRKVF